MSKRTSKQPRLTDDQRALAQSEVTAYYDDKIADHEAAIAKHAAVLLAAQADLAAARTARERWVERHEITEAHAHGRGIVATDPTDEAHCALIGTIELHSSVRATAVMQKVVDAVYGKERREVTDQERDDAAAARERREVLERWLTEQGWPTLGGRR
jgi:hypothetical protein